jgi:ubiquinone/menaquinone biosynthesis C-methylase UbiE
MTRNEPFESYANKYDDWYESGFGKYASQLEEELMLELLKPEPGQTLLDIGCGTGRHLLLFRNLGLMPTGIDSSFYMLRKAKEKIEEKTLFLISDESSFPFENKSFDLSILFLVLEFSKNPIKLLREAERVTQRKIFIGFLNRNSFLAVQRKVRGLFKKSIYKKARLYSLYQLKKILNNSFKFKSLSWKGVIFLPWADLKFWKRLDYRFSFIKNPFCAFIGVIVEL